MKIHTIMGSELRAMSNITKGSERFYYMDIQCWKKNQNHRKIYGKKSTKYRSLVVKSKQ